MYANDLFIKPMFSPCNALLIYLISYFLIMSIVFCFLKNSLYLSISNVNINSHIYTSLYLCIRPIIIVHTYSYNNIAFCIRFTCEPNDFYKDAMDRTRTPWNVGRLLL